MKKALFCKTCGKTTAHDQVGYNAIEKMATYKCGICETSQNIPSDPVIPFRMG